MNLNAAMDSGPNPSTAEEDDLSRRLEHEPGNADVLLRIGWLRLQRGDARGAREVLLKAHVLQPLSAVIRIYAAKALAQCKDSRAPQLIADWQRWLPLPDQQQFDLADVMQQTDWTAEAIGVLEDLSQRSPAHRWAKLLLAALYERVNRLNDAETVISGMLADAAGDDVTVHKELMHQKAGILARRGESTAARGILEQIGPRFDGDTEHFFMLAELADQLDDMGAAMEYLRSAHAWQRREIKRVAPKLLEERGFLLPPAAASLRAEDAARWPELIAPDAAHSPVFVVGFPRSGTTLLEQMLDAHPALQSQDERPHFDVLADQLEEYGVRVPQDLHRLTQADCDELRKGYLMLACSRVQRHWDARLVDKNPMNMLWLPLINRMFPEARFVLMLRHPCDVLLSNYLQYYNSAAMISVSLDLERLAHAYVEAFSHWFHHLEILHPTVLTLRYEELVADTERQAGIVAEYLGLNDASPMLRVDEHARDKGFIGTPSYTEVIKPVNGRHVGRWRRYRPWFGEALGILEPMFDRLGYSAQGDVK